LSVGAPWAAAETGGDSGGSEQRQPWLQILRWSPAFDLSLRYRRM